MRSKFFGKALRAALFAVGLAGASVSLATSQTEPKLADVWPSARLITQEQYLNTLQAMFGPSLRYPTQFAPIHRVDGLVAVGTSAAVITGGVLDQFDIAARLIAQQVVDPAHRDFLIPCHPKSENKPDDACARKFLSHGGQLLFRRPLRPAELKGYVAVAHDAAINVGGFYQGLGATLAGILVAPEFLYVTQDVESSRGQTSLSVYAKAARISLLLWNAYPDEELEAAAQSGALNTDKGLAKQIDRMLDSPRLADGVRNFFNDMLVFENFETLAKDATIYPAFTHKVAADAEEQTLRTMVAHTVDENADYRDLFTTRKTFLTNDLGSIYGISISNPEGWVPYEFPKDSPRAGLLTQLSFLAVYSQPGRSSPTRRGRAIREIFLCTKVPNPPPNVDFSKLEDPGKAYKTARERLSVHRSNPVCAGCHKITDPIGLGLENFDGAGSYRVQETGATIDASGQLDEKSFADANGLGEALRDNPRTPTCLADRLSSYALGRALRPEDKEWQSYIHDQFAAHGYRVKDLLRTIATSKAFFAVPAHPEDNGPKIPKTQSAANSSAKAAPRGNKS